MGLHCTLPFFFLSCFLVNFSSSEVSPCAPKIYEGAFKNLVCVCNSTYCDEIEPLGTVQNGVVVVYRSTLDGDRLKRMSSKLRNRSKLRDFEANVTITVDARNQMQPIIGFGGAFTDAAGENLVALNDAARKKLLEAYFGRNGLEYNMGRVPIASCDFSVREYSYDDVSEDFGLKNFSLAQEDMDYKIPFIISAINLTQGNLQLFASPWSAPGWMKTTGKMRGGGPLRNDSRVYKTYADYFVKFFEAYRSKGIQYWGLTIQNEPSTGADMDWRWQTMNFTAETMRDFLRGYLGPALKANEATRDLKVMVLDDGRGLLPGWADTMFADPETAKYADGVAVHWYGNLYSPAILLSKTNEKHPDKFLFATEACAGYAGHHGPIMGDWFRAESYADDIITDLNNWVRGWTDWNLCLDETGGPNWVFNVVDAPIIVNRTAQEFYKQPMFYALGHFSKFFTRGSKRITVKVEGSLAVSGTAVVLDGGQRALVLLNKASSNTSASIVDAATNDVIQLELPARSIHTVVWNKKK
ncbi:unnamed protein product [Caenorhabditis auriculariae]|uniref:Glucosylceramidase n=1 Tax=Caenorhabditis auriculariae TaxID=2777116 RepID=A0A8S1HF35_9PELO|nr:unnamed protein product [Caenorhabditis auriculariae]